MEKTARQVEKPRLSIQQIIDLRNDCVPCREKKKRLEQAKSEPEPPKGYVTHTGGGESGDKLGPS